MDDSTPRSHTTQQSSFGQSPDDQSSTPVVRSEPTPSSVDNPIIGTTNQSSLASSNPSPIIVQSTPTPTHYQMLGNDSSSSHHHHIPLHQRPMTTRRLHRRRRREVLKKKSPNLDKLKIPEKQGEGYEITPTGTFKVNGTGNVKIGKSGMHVSSESIPPTQIITRTLGGVGVSHDASLYIDCDRNIRSIQNNDSDDMNSSSPQNPSQSPEDDNMLFIQEADNTTECARRSGIIYDELKINKKSKLGSGATANVLRVTHRDKPYALKIIPYGYREVKPTVIIQEVKCLHDSMDCPHIIELLEAYHREGSVRLLLEYMDCGSLEDVYKVERIPENVLSQVTCQILKGLQYLHEKKQIIHRDIKPSNVLLNHRGQVKISDFGMSRKLEQSQAFHTFQGSFMYMSPERLKGESHSFSSDLWSLALSIIECCIGRFPYDVEKFNVWNYTKFISEEGLNLRENEISDDLRHFVNCCLHVSPDKRLSARELLQTPFIMKHNPDECTSKVKSFLKDVYIAKKKAIREERQRRRQEQQENGN